MAKTNNYETIFERLYDNPLNQDGTLKQPKIIGQFLIIEVLRDDAYFSQKIGILRDTDKVYIINEYEVSGFGGGSRFDVKEIESLQQRI